MLFSTDERRRVALGEITLALRHWKRPQAKVGSRHRLAPFGMIEITEVEEQTAAVTERNARDAGFANRTALAADIEKYAARYPGNLLYRVRFRFVEDVDPRSVRAASNTLTSDELATITAKLDRMDARSMVGTWTRETLRLIAEYPARRAGDLADMAGRERLEFKRDVRKLKELGLTLSLEVGYELSPRGRAFVASTPTKA